MNNTTKNTINLGLLAFIMTGLFSCNSSNEDITPILKINAKTTTTLEDPDKPETPPPPMPANF